MAVPRTGQLSGLSTLVPRPGTVARRSPGNRIRFSRQPLGRAVGARAKYLIPPLLALTLVVGVQLYNSVQAGGASRPAANALEPRVPGVVDPVPVTEVAPLAPSTRQTPTGASSSGALAPRRIRSPSRSGYTSATCSTSRAARRATCPTSCAARDAYDKGRADRARQHSAPWPARHASRPRFMTSRAPSTTRRSCSSSIPRQRRAGRRLRCFGRARRPGERPTRPGPACRPADSPAVTIREARSRSWPANAASAAELADEAATAAAGNGASRPSVAFFEFSRRRVRAARRSISMRPTPRYAARSRRCPAIHWRSTGRLALLTLAATPGGDRPARDVRLPPCHAQTCSPSWAISTLSRSDAAKAADQYATVDFIADMAARSAGAVYDREYSLYLADHGTNVGRALELAQAEAAVRHDVYALRHARLGASRERPETRTHWTPRGRPWLLERLDAKLLIHAGLIEIANGLTIRRSRAQFNGDSTLIQPSRRSSSSRRREALQ